jgi:hypothetical protein
MATNHVTTQLAELRRNGPFPERMDPWVENARYFHQFHGEMISLLARQLYPQIQMRGYELGRETSLQIMEGREPDIFVLRAMNAAPLPKNPALNYAQVATTLDADPGVAVIGEINLDALHIMKASTGELVTIIEVVSPSNKEKKLEMRAYRSRRERLLGRGVNIVEIDLTRSVRRLMQDPIGRSYAYHAIAYLPNAYPQFIGMELAAPLKRIAIPLRGEAVAVNLHDAYRDAYALYSLAGQMLDRGHYTAEHLPFPSLLSDAQRDEVLAAVAAWEDEMNALLASLRADESL